MTHPVDDKLLQLVLETLEEPDRTEVSQHMLHCVQCRNREQRLRQQSERIGNIEMKIEIPKLPSLPGTPRRFIPAWRWAAVLCIGFLLGFLTARLSDNSSPPIPVPQRLIPTHAPSSSSGYVTCRAFDLVSIVER